jgi:NAD(P)H-quinone oxidoreductase subunit 5
MHTLTLLVLGFAPLALLLGGLAAASPIAATPQRAVLAAKTAAVSAFAAAVVGAALLYAVGGMAAGALPGLGVSIYADALTAVMLLLVAFVGVVVTIYAATYMDGDPGHARFMRWIALTLAAVTLLIVSGNFLQLVLAWVATSLALHKLLLFYPERPGARLAAAKKQIVSRIGDLCLVGALLLSLQAYGTLQFPELFDAATAAVADDAVPAGQVWIALFLVLAALLKSAQVPVHGWLTEVMETPTPTSALLHAGIINAGGFLVLRMSDLIAGTPIALDTMAVVGALTALLGSAVMLTQTSVKVSLAWSTVSQMGFMMLQCGLGAFSAAALHIVAHSLYKAHAFLASGSVIDLARASWTPLPGSKPHPISLTVAVAAAVALAWVVSSAFGASLTQAPGVFALGAVVVMGVAHLFVSAARHPAHAFVIVRAAGLAVVVSVLYFALQLGAEGVLGSAVPAKQALQDAFDLVLVVLVLLAFGAVTVGQSLLPYETGNPRWQALYVHLFNGLYLNAAFERLVQRISPVAGAPTARPGTAATATNTTTPSAKGAQA